MIAPVFEKGYPDYDAVNRESKPKTEEENND